MSIFRKKGKVESLYRIGNVDSPLSGGGEEEKHHEVYYVRGRPFIAPSAGSDTTHPLSARVAIASLLSVPEKECAARSGSLQQTTRVQRARTGAGAHAQAGRPPWAASVLT